MKDKMYKSMAKKGRGKDTRVAHIAPDEIVIPHHLATDPETKQLLKAMFDHHKVDMDQFTVGNEKNSVNPKTGEIEFGLFSGITKAVKGVVKGVTKAVGGLFGGASAPDNSAIEKQVAEQSKALEDQKRRYEKQQADLAKSAMASLSARRRGGGRSLLSEDREEAMLGVRTKLS
jgi:hypothetical protein